MGAENSVPQREQPTWTGGLNPSTQPLTQTDALLFTPTGKACTMKDTGDFAGRLRQMQIINHAIMVLARETCKDAKDIDFARLSQEVMTYKSLDGVPDPSYPWSLVANDTKTFPALESSVNRFKEFELYLSKKAGAPPEEMKKDMNFFMAIFAKKDKEVSQSMQKQGTVAEIIALVTTLKEVERTLDTLESQLDEVTSGLSKSPVSSDTALQQVLGHVFVTTILPHLPLNILRDHLVMSTLLQRFDLTEQTSFTWSCHSGMEE